MSRRQQRHDREAASAPGRSSKRHPMSPPDDGSHNHKDNVVRRLAQRFQESFDMEIIQSVAQTCQWDFGKATEALIVLGGTTQPNSRRRTRVNSLVETPSSTRYKTKSLPSTLKGHKSTSGRLSDSSTHSMPNGLRAHPAYFSNDSLASSGQVWQRHYKSKPQSPGLLTMIPPSPKDKVVSKPGSSRSSSRASSVKELPEVKEAGKSILRIEKMVQSNVKVMILMRGVPGSGKTYLAQVVVQMVTSNDRGQHIFSTDDYFVMIGRGVYAYDTGQISQAHNWNQKRVLEALRRAVNPVVVDNTNCQAWEMQAYVAMGVQHGYHIEVLEPVTPWRNREAELARRTVHNVPREKIRQMMDRYEPNWTGERLINLFQLKYQHCGAAHVSPEITNLSNSPLAQHRQHCADQPEKPKRKKASPGKKDRRHVPGVEINKNQEQQLEELNKIFAEYGKTIDPESRQKVLEAGVPITEVVSRIRKMQGTVLPLPGVPPSIIEEETTPSPTPNNTATEPTPQSAQNDYFGLHRHSPTESIEPVSSSNSPETSECESDSEPEPLRRYLDACGGQFVEGEDQWEDEEEVKSDGAVSGRSGRSGRLPSHKGSAHSGLVTSSQEELSIIDYQLSTPAGSSQDELSLLEFQRGCTPPGSSSSSEEPKTELSTLQDSLRDVLLRSAASHHPEPDGQLMRDIASQTGSSANLAELAKLSDVETPEKEIIFIRDTVDNIDVALEDDTEKSLVVKNGDISQRSVVTTVDLNDSLIEILRKRLMGEDPNLPVVDKENNVLEPITAKSPDLEEIPLPRIPEPGEDKAGKMRPKLETILESAQSPPDTEIQVEVTKRGGILKHVFDSINWSGFGLETVVEAPKPEPAQRPEVAGAKNVSTITEPADFDLWRSSGPYRVLEATPRLINPPDAAIPQRSKAAVAMFDKGTEPVDEDEFIRGEQDGLEVLTSMFPDVPLLDLADLLKECQGDIQWVAEIITDPSYTMENIPRVEQENRPQPEPDAKLEKMIADGKKTIKRRKDRKAPASELSQLLKKEIENSVQISSQHYSDHHLFIKKVREGEFDLDAPLKAESSEAPLPPFPESAAMLPPEVASTSAEEWPTPGSSGGGGNAWEAEESMSLPLDPAFFKQLVEKFGGRGQQEQMKGYKPVIRIPESLGHTLYWLWVESLSEDVAHAQEADEDDMVQSDALLAVALQELELQDKQPTMQEIADMEIAEKIMLKDQERASGLRTNTAAAVLSKNLLLDKYPTVDKGALMEVFRNEGCSLQRTCDTLKHLFGEPAPPPSSLPTKPPVPERPRINGQNKPLIVIKEPTAKNREQEEDVLVVDPSAFRLQIQKMQQKRADYQRLGKEEISKKNHAVASYFFEEARKLKEQIQEAQQTSITQQPFPFSSNKPLPKTLDLHFLFTGEAVQYVDSFLDLHITRLPSGRQELYLITGRGKNSLSGMSRIRPVVQKRLTERQLSFNILEDNPGMIRVTVHANDLLSTAL